jgi:hypothetical protein
LTSLFVSCGHFSQKQQEKSAIPIVDGKEIKEHYNKFLSTLKKSHLENIPQMQKTKEVYFSQLYKQYLAFTAINRGTEEIKSCPQFHNEYLAINASFKSNQHKSLSVQSKEKRVLTDKMAWIKSEINEICNHGNSSNYYVFHNALEYINPQITKKYDRKVIIVLMKLPIFSNYVYLGKMINRQRLLAEMTRNQKSILNSYFLWLDKYISFIDHNYKI